MARLQGKVAIVTGSAQGIGEGIARAMASEGACLVLFDIKETVHETARKIRELGGTVLSRRIDITDFVQVDDAVRHISEEIGAVAILVNNAGIARFAPFVDMTDSERDEVIRVNFFGMWNCTKAVIPTMIGQQYGKIINVSSVTGPRVATPGLTAYAASKGALSGFTRTLALEVATHGITVNAILPGFIDTPLTKPMADDFHMDQEEFTHWLRTSIPMKRMGTKDEVGKLAVFLASDESTYITGQEIVIDGGNIIQEVKGIPGDTPEKER